MQRSYDFARLTAATTALLTGVDVTIADRFGTSAMDHNFIVLAYAGVMAASVGYSCYCVYKAYDEGGFYGALTVLGVEVTCFATGGIMVKMSAPYIKAALQLALAKKPGLAFVLDVFVDRLAVEVERFLATHAGKTLQVAVAVLERPLARGIERGMQKIDGVVHKTHTLTGAECFAKHGKKPTKEMSTEEFVQLLADRTERSVGAGKGPQLGTEKHKYAEKLAERYKKMTGDKTHLEFEVRYKDGRPWEPGMGTKDHVRPDVYDPEISTVYDFKFGNAKLEQPQVQRYQQQMPTRDGQPVLTQQIKPNLGQNNG